MSTYVRTRDAVVALRNALRPHHRSPSGQRASGFGEDRRRIRSLFLDSNLLGFGVTEKVVQGKAVAGEFSVTFYVRRKLPSTRVKLESIIIKRLRVESLGASVHTDVQPLGGMHVAHATINSGSSIGHISGTAGSATLVAKDMSTQQPLILSCSHVLARAGSDRFMVIDPQAYNTIDAALATPVDGIALLNNIPGLGNIAGALDLSQMADSSVINLRVSKFGASTALQSGQITGTHFTVQIRFPELGDKVVWFTDLLTHNIPSKEGDSGAAVVETNGMNVVAMHIAAAGTSGLCANIQAALDTFAGSALARCRDEF